MNTITMIRQNLKQVVKGEVDLAEKYYNILSAVNNLGLTKREIELIGFTAIRGNISSRTAKDVFCEKYGTTVPTINNIISKLKKKNVFVKTGKVVKINPVIVLDFKKDLLLAITMEHGDR